MRDMTESIKIPLSKCDTFISFDLESTGRSYKTCEIIEVAAMRIEHGAVIDTFQALVKPTDMISQEITELTGITNSMVSDSPSIDKALPDFVKFIGDGLLLGHNISSYDLHLLNRYTELVCGKSISNFYIDTLPLSKKLFPEYPHSLAAFADCCGVCVETSHRALADSELAYRCFLHMMGCFPDFCIKVKKFIPMNQRGNAESQNSSDYFIKLPDSIYQHPDGTDTLLGKGVCVTGEFKGGNREVIKQLITRNGGIWKTKVSNRTDFLVIGSLVEPSSKIEKALSIQKQGGKISIISEHDLFKFLLKEGATNE